MLRPNSNNRWCHYSGLASLESEDIQSYVQTVDISKSESKNDLPLIAWLGHASFVIIWAGKTILIDPVFAKRIGAMPRRIEIADSAYSLKPDAILISHAHMDHLNQATLSKFPHAAIVLPQKSETFLGSNLKNPVVPIALESEFSLGPLTIKAVPAKHGGWRYPWQKGFSATGYLISYNNTTLYYAGDTAFGSHFAQIGLKNSVDIALLPIGAYAPRWFLKHRHLNPPEAIQAAKLLRAKTVIPFHFGTYRLSLDPLKEALPWFVKEAAKSGICWQLTYDQNLFTT